MVGTVQWSIHPTWLGQFNELYFISELSVGQTFRSPNLVRTVWQTILCFLTDLIIRCKLQPKLCCRLYTDTHAHAQTWHMQPFIHSRPKALAMDTKAVPCAHIFISLYLLGPSDNADSPVSPQMRPLPLKWQAENCPSAMCSCPSFFLFHRRALRFPTIRCKVCQTQQTVPSACRAKRFGPRTQLRHSSSNCPNQVRQVKVCLIKNGIYRQQNKKLHGSSGRGALGVSIWRSSGKNVGPQFLPGTHATSTNLNPDLPHTHVARVDFNPELPNVRSFQQLMLQAWTWTLTCCIPDPSQSSC